MHSSHPALCTALTTSVALCHGVADTLFPFSLGFILIIMYDATGVGRHAGMQAELVMRNDGPGVIRLYSCYKCGTHVALHDDIVSKHFQAGNWRAYLFTQATNIKLGQKENRQLITGLHTVCDVFCADCGENLGWKYEQAFEATQKYKEGKVVLEKYKLVMDIL